jgi:hypoxanthine-DNA glycosylase
MTVLEFEPPGGPVERFAQAGRRNRMVLMLSQAFDPIADARTRLLVLGSLPGRKSLEARRYYAHPTNQFWQLMSPVAGTDLGALDYPDRLEALLSAGIGLWDVIGSAERAGSLDTAIRNPALRDLSARIATLPTLRAVAFNGGTAFRHGSRQLTSHPHIALIGLPSSSAAYTIGLAAKQPAWSELRDFLSED